MTVTDTRGREAAEWFIDMITGDVVERLTQQTNVQALPDSIREPVFNMLHGAAQSAAGHSIRMLIEYDALSVAALYASMVRERGR